MLQPKQLFSINTNLVNFHVYCVILPAKKNCLICKRNESEHKWTNFYVLKLNRQCSVNKLLERIILFNKKLLEKKTQKIDSIERNSLLKKLFDRTLRE